MSESVSESDKSELKRIKETIGVSYDLDTETTDFVGDPTDTQQYILLVEYLVEHKHIQKDDLPISAKRAQTRYLINSSASHENREMIRPSKVGDGVFLETNHDTSSKKRYASRFIKEFVLNQ